MAVIVGSARIDENGKAKGGKAGDQTGRELSTQNWYKHSKGWRVFRAKSAEVAEKIAQCMERACKNSKIGYDQYQRNTLYNVAKPLGFDTAKVTTACETDCSALVRVCCAYAGIMLLDIRTTNEASALLKSGAFEELTGAKYTDSSALLLRGDILVTKTQGHTVVVLSNGSKAEPRPSSDLPYVEVTYPSVYVRKGPGTTYGILGIVKKGDRLTYQDTFLNGWYLVEYEGKNAAITNKYTRLVKP